MTVKKPLYTAARTLSVATALSVIFAGSAFALDGNDVAKRLQSRFEEQGSKIEFSGVETDGTTVTLRDSKISFDSAEIDEVKIGDIVLTNVAEDDKGGYSADKATLADVVKKDDGATFTLKGIEIGNIYLASDDEQDPVVKMMYYQSMKADTLTVDENGEEFVSMKDLYANTSPYTKGSPISVNFGVKSMDFDIEKMEALRKKADKAEGETEKADTPNPMLDLGYNKLNVVLSSTANWNPEKGDFSIDKLEFDAKDVGKFDLTLKLGGYDVKFIQSLQQMSAQLNENKENKEAAGMAVLGLIQQLSVSDISMRYDDSSLTPKLLEYYAKQQSISKEDMVNQIKGIAPLMVGYLGHADFAIQATTAINTYFDDPKSLTLAAKPEAPVSFALIAATATADPKKIIDLLAVKLTANQ